ncbi:MAG: hypothetical protein IPK02_07050 [Candidatus Accumulibacter sp.]|uniref:Uncharacterized protein n=1 Tax=Candidatus Accumulibacter affinis TaxID=2954384 RepID=A0A935TAA5_9PROT|nr:hypothetical protein [Candidatus Accumulibacter affinis]
MRDAAGKMSMNTPPAAKAHWPVLCAAHEKVDRLKSQASSLESQIRPLLRVLDAPDAFAQAKKKLDDLVTQNKAQSAEVENTEALIAKICQRVADLRRRIAAETSCRADDAQ